MKILLIAEHDNKHLKLATHHAVSAVATLEAELDVLVIGFNCHAVASEAAALSHIHSVRIADDAVYEHQLAENTAQLIAEFGKMYTHIVMPSGATGKNILPRVAALLDVGMITDVVQVVSANTFVRPIYAGNVLATVQSNDVIKVLSIRTTAFPAAKPHAKKAPIVKATHVIPNTLATFVSQSLTQSTRPELTTARVVIAGGRGLKSAENFHLLEGIADQLGAAIGASRAAVDAGFAPNDYQVGQTGKVVAPDLYIAVGISGAIQHLAGMKDSKVIVAINNDPDAPIFEVADYGLVGDLFEVLPAIQKALS